MVALHDSVTPPPLLPLSFVRIGFHVDNELEDSIVCVSAYAWGTFTTL